MVAEATMKSGASPNSLNGCEFRLREHLIRPELNRIEHGESSVTVEPRVMDVLVYLAEHAGKVVSREQMLDDLWGDAVVVEHALTRTISELRRLLGDNPEKPLYIETIRKRGYRLVAPVIVTSDGREETPSPPEIPGTQISGPRVDAPPPDPPVSAPPVATPPLPAAPPSIEAPKKRGVRIYRQIVGLTALVAVVVIAWILGHDRFGANRSVVLQTVPFTSYVGSEQMPSLSPDGTRVAFSWAGPDRDNVDIYIKQKNADVPQRLTTDPGYDTNPVWSPDDAGIAFVRNGNGEVGIWIIPSIGGVEREVYRAASRISGIDWSPDGMRIIFSEQSEVAGSSCLKSLDLESLEVHDLNTPPRQRSDVEPAVSPDGKSIAFIRQNPAGYKQIYSMPASGGEAHALTQEMRLLYGFTWRGNSKEIIFASPSAGPADLWQLSVERRAINPIPTRDQWLARPSCARRGPGLVCETWTCDSDVWEIGIDDQGRASKSATPLIRSTRWDGYAVMSPDGRRVAFASGRSGRSEIWICESDGSRPVQLTSLNGLSIGSTCCWSADGKEIAYSTSPDGFAAVFVIGVAGGRAKRLSFGRFHEQVCDWSADGRWIYYASDREDGWQIWRMRPDGSDRARLTSGGGIEGFESSDDHWLYFVRPEGGGVWRVAADGGEEAKVLDLPSRTQRSGWTVHGMDIYYYDSADRGCFLVRRSIQNGETMNLAPVPGTPGPGIDVSPDGTRLIYARSDDNVSDLVLIEGYR
jgi:Tol biopolymer transport system component/DNA-binding winged helix-turn-helix (wHTH) protein